MKTKQIFLLLSAFLLTVGTGRAQDGKKFSLPKYEKFQLDNGLTVYLMEDHEVPMISMRAIFPGGAVKDGKKSGLANLTAAGLLFGTKSFSKEQIEETFDFHGATFGASADLESSDFEALFMAKHSGKLLPIIKELIVNPVFNEAEFEKRKKRTTAGLEQDRESPRAVIGNYFSKFMYGNHVYGKSEEGTVKSVNSLVINDLRKFYKDNYLPDFSALAFVGDFETKAFKKQISDLFKEWKKHKGDAADFSDQPVKFPNAKRVLLVNKSDARETTFWIGGQGIRRDNPDYVPVQVLNTILGGRFTSWLNDALRVNAGLTYGARSSFTPLRYSGMFSVRTFTATKTTEACVDMALRVYGSLHKNGVSEEILESAKNYVKGSFPPRYESAGARANLLTDMFRYNYDERFITYFSEKVNELDVKKANEIIKKYFPKKNLQFVLVGKAEEIREIAKKYGPVTEKEITADGY